MSATAPTTGSPNAVPAWFVRPSWLGEPMRIAIYALVLIGLGGWLCFSRLGEGMLACDEASFAYTSDRMLRTGDWVVPHIHELGPHLNAAPLYNWLTNLTGPLFDDSYLRYRIWSAVFGIGCALAALALGALLFGAEVGFLAGMFLLINVSFVFQHGARASVMEAGLAFLVTMMTVCYVRTFQAPHRARLWWALTGVFLGLAVLMKPPAMGGFFFCTLCLHHLLARHDLSYSHRLLGPLGAGMVAAVVSLPWYGAIYFRLGPDAIDHLFLGNSVRRAASAGNAAQHPPTYYLEAIWASSHGFRWALPALGWGVVCIALGWNRRAWGVLVLPAAAFLAVISMAATKHHHYMYAAFPLLAVAAAAILCTGLLSPPAGDRPVGRGVMRLVALLGTAIAMAAVWADVRRSSDYLNAPRWDYPALRIHQTAENELAAGTGRLVLYKFPATAERLDRKLGFTAHDRYYLARLPHAVCADSPAELNRILATRTPTVVILPPSLPPAQLTGGKLTATPDRTLFVRSDLFTYPVFLFHDAETRLGLGELLRTIELPAGKKPHCP